MRCFWEKPKNGPIGYNTKENAHKFKCTETSHTFYEALMECWWILCTHTKKVQCNRIFTVISRALDFSYAVNLSFRRQNSSFVFDKKTPSILYAIKKFLNIKYLRKSFFKWVVILISRIFLSFRIARAQIFSVDKYLFWKIPKAGLHFCSRLITLIVAKCFFIVC